MKQFKKSLALLCTTLVLPASANFLATDISNDAFRIEIGNDRLVPDTQFSLAAIGTDDDRSVLSFKGMVSGPLQASPNLTAGLGAKAYFIDLDDETVQAFALGGQAVYKLHSNPAVTFQGQLFYAPGILMSDDFDYQTDIMLRAKYQLLPNGAIYAGYRHIKVNGENGPSYTLDKGINLGIEFKF